MSDEMKETEMQNGEIEEAEMQESEIEETVLKEVAGGGKIHRGKHWLNGPPASSDSKKN